MTIIIIIIIIIKNVLTIKLITAIIIFSTNLL